MNFIQRFIHAATLDIFETYPNACHEPLSNNFELFLNKTRWRKSRLSIVWQVYYFAGLTSLYWLRKRFNKRPIVGGDIVFLWQTENQKNSLSPIEKEINSRHPTAVVDDQSLGFITRSATTYLLSLFFFPVCIFQYLKSTGYQRKTFPLVFDRYLLGYGVYFRLSRWFEKGAPKAIVIANDHSQFPCLVVAAAKASNVPTFYVQHACVTDRFPKLIFDYALLDGMDAEAKYLAAGKSDTDIRLIGPSRLDGYVDHINNNRDVSSIGVCFSLSDDESRINELLEMLVELNGFSISLRPHYRMSQAFHNRIKEFANLNGFTYSEHKTVPALQFMKSIDLLIAGVSAITMEASMMNLTLANFQLCETVPDWYGFIKNGLVKSFDEVDGLRCFIFDNALDRETSRHLAKRYAHSVGETFDGASAQYAAAIIDDVINSLEG